MSLLSIIIALIVVGVLLYLLNQFVPMDAKIKRIINIVVVVVVIIWILKVLGAWNYLSNITI